MRVEHSIHIDAPPEVVWRVTEDVERWPEWTASVERVERLDDGPLQVGSRARLKQPKFPPTVWEVTDVDPGRSFSWKNKSVGLTSVGHHRVVPRPVGGATVALALRQSGPLAPLLGILTSRLSQRYVETEAQGLKRRCETQ